MDFTSISTLIFDFGGVLINLKREAAIDAFRQLGLDTADQLLDNYVQSGIFMQLENGQSSSDMPNKHTLIVPPGKTVTALLTADELGEWAIHCHLLYHMSSGMMSKMIVANVDGNQAATAPSSPSSVKQGDSHAQH